MLALRARAVERASDAGDSQATALWIARIGVIAGVAAAVVFIALLAVAASTSSSSATTCSASSTSAATRREQRRARVARQGCGR